MTNLCREAALGPIRTLDASSIETIDITQVSRIFFYENINIVIGKEMKKFSENSIYFIFCYLFIYLLGAIDNFSRFSRCNAAS